MMTTSQAADRTPSSTHGTTAMAHHWRAIRTRRPPGGGGGRATAHTMLCR